MLSVASVRKSFDGLQNRGAAKTTSAVIVIVVGLVVDRTVWLCWTSASTWPGYQLEWRQHRSVTRSPRHVNMLHRVSRCQRISVSLVSLEKIRAEHVYWPMYQSNERRRMRKTILLTDIVFMFLVFIWNIGWKWTRMSDVEVRRWWSTAEERDDNSSWNQWSSTTSIDSVDVTVTHRQF